MRISIIVVGKPLTGPLDELVKTYEKRLHPHTITWKYIAPASVTDPDTCRHVESAAISKLLTPGQILVLLDERGSMPDNQSFATQFEQWLGRQGRLVFVIGGAYGVTHELRASASYVWSLSPLVFPHQLVRLLLMEQLYRTTALLQGHPYHHM